MGVLPLGAERMVAGAKPECAAPVQAGGSELAAAITGAGLALADAGIELVDLVAACSVVSRAACRRTPNSHGAGSLYLRSFA